MKREQPRAAAGFSPNRGDRPGLSRVGTITWMISSGCEGRHSIAAPVPVPVAITARSARAWVAR